MGSGVGMCRGIVGGNLR
ncbi:hypothetical protein A2U01_0088152, partial [Trifolium medium]|nr:hypothetical protein [Trifolium medium]